MLYPPLKTLPVFLTAAQSNSFLKAAETHCITLPAVSQQIKALEYDLNCQLFERTNNKVKLTEKGRIFYESITPALKTIEQAKFKLVNDSTKHITLSLLNSISTFCLIPNLGDFYLQYPEVDIRLSTNWSLPLMQQHDVDLIIGYGNQDDWLNHTVEYLSSDRLVAVCHPDLYFTGDIVQMFDENKLLMINDIQFRQQDWQKWTNGNNLPCPSIDQLTSFGNTVQAIYACLNKVGILVTHELFVRQLIDQKQLITIGEVIDHPAYGYYLVYLKEDSQAITNFTLWLKAIIHD